MTLFYTIPVSIVVVGMSTVTAGICLRVYRQQLASLRWTAKQNLRLTRRVFWQSFWYLVAFWMTIPVILMSYYWPYRSANDFWVILLAALLSPAQGFLNAFVYFQRSGTLSGISDTVRRYSSVFSWNGPKPSYKKTSDRHSLENEINDNEGVCKVKGTSFREVSVKNSSIVQIMKDIDDQLCSVNIDQSIIIDDNDGLPSRQETEGYPAPLETRPIGSDGSAEVTGADSGIPTSSLSPRRSGKGMVTWTATDADIQRDSDPSDCIATMASTEQDDFATGTREYVAINYGHASWKLPDADFDEQRPPRSRHEGVDGTTPSGVGHGESTTLDEETPRQLSAWSRIRQKLDRSGSSASPDG